MTDEIIEIGDTKPKKSNVKPLHKGIKVDNEDKPVIIIQEVVDTLQTLLDSAKLGEVIGLVYTTANKDHTSDYHILGAFPIPDRTQNILRVLDDDFYEYITRPNISGETIDYDE